MKFLPFDPFLHRLQGGRRGYPPAPLLPQLTESLPEPFEGNPQILRLRPLLRGADRDSGGKVLEPDRGLCLVLPLPPGAAGTVGFYEDLLAQVLGNRVAFGGI